MRSVCCDRCSEYFDQGEHVTRLEGRVYCDECIEDMEEGRGKEL